MDFYVKCKTMKLLGNKSTGEKIWDLDWGKEFLDLTPKVQSRKGIIEKHQIYFHRAKLNGWKDKLQGGRKYFQTIHMT